MSAFITVYPVSGRTVLMPDQGYKPVPATGIKVSRYDQHFTRAIAVGDLSLTPPGDAVDVATSSQNGVYVTPETHPDSPELWQFVSPHAAALAAQPVPAAAVKPAGPPAISTTDIIAQYTAEAAQAATAPSSRTPVISPPTK